MKFSVLMSLYFKEETSNLKECLQSLAQQTILADEIIIVFDGAISKELEIAVVDFLQMLPIRIIRLEQNLGLGKALNEGLKHCSNEWVFRMDTDDICSPDRFEKQLNYIKANPHIVLLGGQISEFENDPSECSSSRIVPCDTQEIKEFSQKRNPFNHMTVAYRKSIILDKLGGYKHHLYMEDYNLWLRVIAEGYEVANLPDTLVYARAGNDMLTRRKGITYIKSEWQLVKLKRKLKIESMLNVYIIFVLRSLPRLLPNRLLSIIYNNLIRK